MAQEDAACEGGREEAPERAHTLPKPLVKVIYSPFCAVKRGETGEVVARLHVGTKMEVWRVRFKRGKGHEDWHFKPYDLKAIP